MSEKLNQSSNIHAEYHISMGLRKWLKRNKDEEEKKEIKEQINQ
jgi:hypothetical protein